MFLDKRKRIVPSGLGTHGGEGGQDGYWEVKV